MNFLKWRVFNMVLLLAIAATMPGVINAQTAMSEIPLSSGGGSGGGTQGFAGGSIQGVLGGGDVAAASTAGPEAVAFDGTYVWVARQFNNAITRIRVTSSALAEIGI